MTKQVLFNFQLMTNTRFIWCYLFCLFISIRNIHSTLQQAQFLSFCNQTINISSPLSIIFARSSLSSSTCCNLTVNQKSSTDLSENIMINIINSSQLTTGLQITNKQNISLNLLHYSIFNQTFFQTNITNLPLTFSLCQFNLSDFQILITNISKGPCLSNQYRCLISSQDQWCIDEKLHCDGYYSCPQGIDELSCPKTMSRLTLPKMKRAIHGGIVTSIIIIGLLLIISSVSIAVAFVYFQRKRQRRRQFTYSLESTSDDWEPSGAGYHLFDNWTNNRRSTTNNIDNVIVDANEHMPITSR